MKIYLKKIFALLIIILQTSIFAQEKEKTSYIPIAKYGYLHTEKQTIQNKNFGLIIQNKNLLIVGFTSFFDFEKNLLSDYPQSYLGIDFISEYHTEKSQFLFLYSSYTDRPEKMEAHTLQSAIVYGHKFIDRKDFSLIFGGGLAVSDFGIEYADGKPWILFPVPFLRISSVSEFVETKFEFISSPNLEMNFFPKSKIRASFDGRIDQFRDERDLLFESKLHYRFFDENHKLGDFAGIAIGFKNDNYGGFDLTKRAYNSSDDKESIELQYNSIFGNWICLSSKFPLATPLMPESCITRERLKQQEVLMRDILCLCKEGGSFEDLKLYFYFSIIYDIVYGFI